MAKHVSRLRICVYTTLGAQRWEQSRIAEPCCDHAHINPNKAMQQILDGDVIWVDAQKTRVTANRAQFSGWKPVTQIVCGTPLGFSVMQMVR